MQLYVKKEDCCGCGACMNACPKNAIRMEADNQGFLYPVINAVDCINCGLCKQNCQIRKSKTMQNERSSHCFGVKNHDYVRAVSSSGGVFTAILDEVINGGGVVVGATFDSEMNVVHKTAQTRKECDAFRGSKYVQSDMGNIYKKVADTLSNKKKVLFSGTPCQVAGIKKYLEAHRIEMSGLYTIDLVCHGAPSPKIWKEYISVLENKYHSKIKNYTFRDKSAGWRGYHVRVELEDGRSVAQNDLTQSFAIVFGKEVMLRPSCFYCPYASMQRCGDITIGDFWGIDKIDKNFSDNKGISMVLINTSKGQEIFMAIKSELDVKEYSSEVLKQPNLRKSTDFSVDYDIFWSDYDSKNYLYIAKKYGEYGLLRKIRYYKNAIKRKLMN